jgi:hypothetical protein
LSRPVGSCSVLAFVGAWPQPPGSIHVHFKVNSAMISRRIKMRNLLLMSVLLLGGAWAAAQTSPSQSSSSPANQGSSNASQTSSASQTSADNSGNQTKVEGCLSSSNGSYTLTAADGTAYQLSGDTSQLNDHVGHEVQITGTKTPASASSSSGNAGASTASSGQTGSSNQPTLNVSSFKHISKTCSNSGSSR